MSKSLDIITSERSALFVTPQLVERISRSEKNLLAIDTEQVSELLLQFKHHALRTGAAFYAWNPDDGIVSLKETHMVVPGSGRLVEALRHVASSAHFGCYLLTGFRSQLQMPTIQALKQIARPRGSVGKKLIFLGTNFRLPAELQALTEWLVDPSLPGSRLRLRDGRWINCA